MNRDTVIRKSNGGGVAILHLREMNSPSWAHVRQDYWIPANELSLVGHDIRTEGRYFTDRYVVSTQGDFLLIEEMQFDGTQDSVDLHASRLLLIDTDNATVAEVGKIDDGHSFPKSIDPEKVVYTKMKRTESGVHHEFERDISSLIWKSLMD